MLEANWSGRSATNAPIPDRKPNPSTPIEVATAGVPVIKD
jgi:hypothetical protein